MLESTSGDDMAEQKPSDKITKRKQDHIDICLNFTSEIEMNKTTGFEDIHFIPKALPDIDFDDINLSTKFLNHEFKYPIFISSITGGTKKAKKINENLAKLAKRFGIGIGVGSQRAAIEDNLEINSFTIVRDFAPNAFVAANLGAIQFNNNFTMNHAKEAIKMINANALILHLNPLQEVIQPEGDRNFDNLTEKIVELNKKLNHPLIIKEVGSGISFEIVKTLIDNKIAVVDIAGAGGTSWSQIEAIRAEQQGQIKQQKTGKLFKNWGIPTAVSTAEVATLRDQIEIISSGGIRNGLQAAKALSLGANLVGIGLPLACLASSGTEKQLIDWMEQFIHELKTAMFLIGVPTVEDLLLAPLVVTGKTLEWINSRGIVDINDFKRG
ncbi:MAG: type 2 isopentenyl-diphosphate Delta-isomerase [Asgard group archaeon]|nr:type 2 isopentenyl-diphosphate Delta-isomerase [Asgard group archaeon]